MWVFGGNGTDSPLLAEISGDHFNHTAAFPTSFDVPGDDAEILVRFTSDAEKGPSNIPQYGFQMTWSAPYCGKTGPHVNLTESRATFSDGSGDESYIPDSHCRWVIRPGYTGIRLILWSMVARAGVDFIRVYSGDAEPEAANLLAEWSFSNHKEPSHCVRNPKYHVETEAAALVVEFVAGAGDPFSRGSADMAGWEMEYVPTPKCERGPVLITDPRGTLNDGSPWEMPYAPYSNCTWIIAPESGTGPVTVVIRDMMTASNQDLLYVYSGHEPMDRQLMAVFSGNYHTEVLPFAMAASLGQCLHGTPSLPPSGTPLSFQGRNPPCLL